MINGEESALNAGLRYVSDLTPGIVRRGVPGRFRYEYKGSRVKDAEDARPHQGAS